MMSTKTASSRHTSDHAQLMRPDKASRISNMMPMEASCRPSEGSRAASAREFADVGGGTDAVAGTRQNELSPSVR